MTAIGTYRKCYKCGYITNNVEATKCECGGFLYLISQIYMPKAAKEQQKEKRRAMQQVGLKARLNNGKEYISYKRNERQVHFSYSGDLTEALAKAERDLKAALNDPNIEKWVWIKDKAEKAIKANNGRVRKLREFIKVAKRQLEREEKEVSNE